MTTQEIETLLGVPNSTLSDWTNGSKRHSLAKLLRAIDIKAAKLLINIEEQKPRISLNTQRIKLNKKLYKKDLLWSREDGSTINIKNLISIYLNTPSQDDTQTLLQQFGEVRVLNVLEKNKAFMHGDDYAEAKEQIEYALSPDKYVQMHKTEDVKALIKEPKQRNIEILMKQFSIAKILEIAKAQNLSFRALFQLKKILGTSV